MKKDIYANPWNEIAATWKNMKSPNIPNEAEKKIYEKYIKLAKRKNPKTKALIFGATVEIRDLLYKNKVDAVVCDLSMNMIIALTQLCKHKNITDSEVWLKADWINAPLPENYFDIILADGAINQLPTGLYDKFLESARKFLKPSGIFIQRTGIVRKEYFKKDEEIMEHFLQQKNPQPDMVFETLTLYSSAMNKKNMETSVRRIYQIMDKYFEKIKGDKKVKLGKVIKAMEASYPRNNKTWTMPSMEDMTKAYKKHFSKIKIESAKDYDSFIPAYPFYIVSKL